MRNKKRYLIPNKFINKFFFFFPIYTRRKIMMSYRLLTNRIRLLPDFIIIGVARCGTTSLYNYLVKHPYIFPALRKEINFFSINFNRGLGWYRTFFPSRIYKFFIKWVYKRHLITGEATPFYIFHPLALKRIYL